jgi:hypothetical protein
MTSQPDPWTRRDLPVLKAIVDQCEAGKHPVRATDVAQSLDLPVDQVRRAVTLLGRDGYLMLPTNAPRAGSHAGEFINDITPNAMRAVDLWPTPDTAFDRMIAALEAIAEHTDDEDTRTRTRKILDGFAGAGKTIGLGVATAAITGQLPT